MNLYDITKQLIEDLRNDGYEVEEVLGTIIVKATPEKEIEK